MESFALNSTGKERRIESLHFFQNPKMWTILLISGIIAALTYLYLSLKLKYNFWKNRHVEGPEPHLLFGNTKDLLLLKTSMGKFLQNMYDNSNEKMVGLFFRSKPILLLRDPELVKDVLIKDFHNFASRGSSFHEKVEPLSQHLFNLEPQRWRPLRQKMTPVFTSGKLREMFYILQDCCSQFGDYLEKATETENEAEVRELALKFTTDVIGSCAFGLDMKALSDEESEFRKMGRHIFAFDFWTIVKFRIRNTFPWLYKTLWWIFYDYEMNDFFISNVKGTMDYRDKENVVRHDFVDVLREIRAHPETIKEIGV